MCKFCEQVEKAKAEYKRSVKEGNSNYGEVIASGPYVSVDLIYRDGKYVLLAGADYDASPIYVNYCLECGKKL